MEWMGYGYTGVCSINIGDIFPLKYWSFIMKRLNTCSLSVNKLNGIRQALTSDYNPTLGYSTNINSLPHSTVLSKEIEAWYSNNLVFLLTIIYIEI